MDLIPSEKLSNYIYKNNGDLTFEKKIKDWGLSDKTFANGAVYVDLDNDGDLDLVTNNFNNVACLYRNNANTNFFQVELKGSASNALAIGTKIYLKNKNTTQFQELHITRGYFSSVTNILHFGLGKADQIDELLVIFPDGKSIKQNNIKANQRLVLDYNNAKHQDVAIAKFTTKKQQITPATLGINYQHQENEFNDLDLQLLLPQLQSTKGTGITKADVNGDGLEDFYVGNAKGAAASLYLQQPNGKFIASNTNLWQQEAKYEDANALFFDADGDGDPDLYVVSAGYELKENSPLLQDRLYINNGKGTFTKNTKALPKMLQSGKTVVAADYDKDGDLDLFVGGNVVPHKYPLPPQSYLLENTKGTFKDVTPQNADLSKIGMVSEALFTDYDNDKDLDLLVVGEWMAPTFFTNNNGNFTQESTPKGLESTEGWWFSITSGDYDGDGDIDYVLGNLGKNNKFHPTEKKPLYIYAKDFDNNGSFDVAMSKINEGKLVPVRGKECSSEQNPFLLDKISTYKEFASLDMEHIYGEKRLKDAFQLQVHNFKSMYVENLGDGTFTTRALPNEAQTGPTLSLLSTDINNDGHTDIIGVGAIYDAEVETIRYDSNYGYVLLGDGKGNFTYSNEYRPFIDKDTKDIEQIKINNKQHFMVVSNNAPLDVFTFQP